MRRSTERPTEVAVLDAGPVEYRLERRGDTTVVVLHGGHMRAGVPLGEEVFAEAGFTVLAPSRPGYGRTPVTTGSTPAAFSDAVAELCARLGIGRVAAVVGFSGGGPTAVTFATRHPEMVDRLILQSAVGPLPWPDTRTRIGGRIVFSALTEPVTWAMLHVMLRWAPETGLRLLMRGLSTLPATQVVAELDAAQRAFLIDLFSRMRSGHGFRNDLRSAVVPATGVAQPTLVIATRRDGGVPFAHADALAAAIRRATLVESRASSHVIWLGSDWPQLAEAIVRFMTKRPDGGE